MLFAALDAALAALGETRIRALRDGASERDLKAVERYLAHPSVVHARLLTGRVVSVTCAAGLTVSWFSQAGGTNTGLAGAAVVALVYGVLAEAASTFTRRHASGVSVTLLRRMRPLEWLVSPLALPLAFVGTLVERAFPPRPEEDPERVTEADVEHLVEQGEEVGTITEDRAAMLRGVLDLRDTTAREIMVPRTQMQAIDLDTPIEDALSLIIETGHSRYPVYRDQADQMHGVLYAKDLFPAVRDRGMKLNLADIVRTDVFFCAPAHPIGSLLREMQSRRVHLAVVTDEFGGTAGIITLEDILEEIVGDIRDEHDYAEPPVRQLGEGRFVADASVSLHDLEDVVGVSLRDEECDYESLGGLLVDIAGRVPAAGERLKVSGLHFVVTESDARHVRRVEINAGEDAAQ